MDSADSRQRRARARVALHVHRPPHRSASVKLQPLFAPAPRVDSPVFRYFGGKWIIADWIAKLMYPHRKYVELFCGAASVTMKKLPAKIEVLNDINLQVVNFFLVLQTQLETLIQILETTPFSREVYEHAKKKQYVIVMGEANVQAAADFFIRAYMGIGGSGGKQTQGGFRTSLTHNFGHGWEVYTNNLHHVAKRLRSAVIENRDAITLIEYYDEIDTLFYADPPYMLQTRGTHRYQHDFTEENHQQLLQALKNTKGHVLISGYHCELYDDMLKDWECHEITLHDTSHKKRVECIWRKCSIQEAAA